MIRFSVVLQIACAVAVVTLLAWVFFTDEERPEDQRETRRYGEMECVYNVTADEVESCVRVPG